MRGYISQAAGRFLIPPLPLGPLTSMGTSLGIWLENNNQFEHLNRRRAFRIGGQSRLSTIDDQGFSSGSGMKPCSLRDLITPRIR